MSSAGAFDVTMLLCHALSCIQQMLYFSGFLHSLEALQFECALLLIKSFAELLLGAANDALPPAWRARLNPPGPPGSVRQQARQSALVLLAAGGLYYQLLGAGAHLPRAMRVVLLAPLWAERCAQTATFAVKVARPAGGAE